MKRIIIIMALLAIISVSVIGISYLFSDRVVINNPKKYMKIERETETLLSEYAKGILPLKETITPQNCKYKYIQDTKTFTCPVCLIYLESKYEDESRYESEKQRISKLSEEEYSIDENTVLYSAKEYFELNQKAYIDNPTDMRKKFIFEFAVVNNAESTVKYIFAVQEGNPKDSELYDVLNECKVNGLQMQNGAYAFKLSKYEKLIDYDEYNENVGPIEDAETAKEKARELFTERFNNLYDSIENQPLNVSYDEENECWLINGSVIETESKLTSVPHVLIKKDGNVLAIWCG